MNKIRLLIATVVATFSFGAVTQLTPVGTVSALSNCSSWSLYTQAYAKCTEGTTGGVRAVAVCRLNTQNYLVYGPTVGRNQVSTANCPWPMSLVDHFYQRMSSL